MTVRRGRDQFLPTSEYAPIDLSMLGIDMSLGPGETMQDVFSRIDPGHVAVILGITEDGEMDSRTIPAYGGKLFTNGELGVDLIVVPPHSGFPPHVHPGHHLLYCVSGRGTFALSQVTYDVEPGYLAMVEGNVPHAVGNPFDQPHVLLAFGSPPRELDSPDRMRKVMWDGTPVLVPDEE